MFAAVHESGKQPEGESRAARPSGSSTLFRKAFHIEGNDDLRRVSLTYALQVLPNHFSAWLSPPSSCPRVSTWPPCIALQFENSWNTTVGRSLHSALSFVAAGLTEKEKTYIRIHIGTLHLWQTTPAQRPLLPRTALISASGGEGMPAGRAYPAGFEAN